MIWLKLLAGILLINRADSLQPLNDLLTQWYYPSSLLPSTTSFTDTIIGSQVHNQSPVNLNRPVHKIWEFNGNPLQCCFLASLKNLTVNWSESNKGWVKDTMVQLVQGSNKKSKIEDRGSKPGRVWSWNKLQRYYGKERKTSLYDCFGDGRWKTIHTAAPKKKNQWGQKCHCDDCLIALRGAVRKYVVSIITFVAKSWSQVGIFQVWHSWNRDMNV